MVRSGVSKLERYVFLPNEKLENHFTRSKMGYKNDIKTPFGKHHDANLIKQQWLKEIQQLKKQPMFYDLYNYELEMCNKMGPLSVMLPLRNRMEGIKEYFTALPNVPVSRSAIAAVIKYFQPMKGIHPRSAEKTVERMRLNTNSGTPFYCRRNDVKSITMNSDLISYEGVVTLESFPKLETKEMAAILGWRGRESGEFISKQRTLWMFPFSVNIQELRVYQPAIEIIQRYNLIPAYVSTEAVDVEMTKLFKTKGYNDKIVCTDFSSFDAHFNLSLQQCTFEIMKNLLNDSEDANNWLDAIYNIKYNIPLIVTPEIILGGHHGMASGSGGTNFDESLAHRALQFESAQGAKQLLNSHSMCLGDDGVITYPHVDVAQVIDSYTQHGLEMQPSKQHVDEITAIYLRRWYHKQYKINGINVGVYPTFRALNRMLHQERFYDSKRWNKKMVTLRYLSILENIKFHPLRERFVDFCMKRDKYRLGLDIPGFFDNIEDEAKEAVAYMPDFLGYQRSLGDPTGSGISEWWITRYLRSLE